MDLFVLLCVVIAFIAGIFYQRIMVNWLSSELKYAFRESSLQKIAELKRQEDAGVPLEVDFEEEEVDYTILFHRINPEAIIPERHGACYDLAVPEDINVPAGETVKIGLGFSAKLPEYCHAKIYMRSSTWSKFGILMSNSVGIIDNSYCGDNDEWIVSVYRKRSSETDVVIPKGTRIAQFEVCWDCDDYEFEVVETLNSEDRGGFGSTGN